jgi:hypothetical protein
VRRAALLLVVLACAAHAAEPPILPSDYFQPHLGKLEDSVDIKAKSEREFELRQHVGGGPIPRDAGSVLNYAAFCIATGISSRRGFSGWSMSTKPIPIEQPIKERFVTVLLAKSPEDVKAAVPPQWTGYIANVKMRDGICKQFVNPKYLK